MSVWIEKLIPINEYSRPGYKLQGVKKIVDHYTANPGASAYNHYLYFGKTLIEQNKKLPKNKRRYASAHIFVDKSDAYLIIPLNEVAYHANDGTFRGVEELKPNANYSSIGVELCIEKDGTFHPETVKRAAQINAELCKMFNLDPIKDIVRHYDVTRKNCPAPWVKNENTFVNFKNLVKQTLNQKLTTPVEKAWKVVKVVNSKYGLYTIPGERWKEDSRPFVGWTFVVRKKQTVNGQLWYELYLGDCSYGWIAAHQTEEQPCRWAYVKEDTESFLHSDLKTVFNLVEKGSKIAILDESEDKFLIVHRNQPQWIQKKIVEF